MIGRRVPLLLGGAAPAGPTVLLRDTFTAPDGTHLTAHTMDVGSGWSLDNGTDPTITGNQVPGQAYWLASADAGSSDGTVSATITPTTSDSYHGVRCRVGGAANKTYYMAAVDGNPSDNLWVLLEITNETTYTARAGGPAVVAAGVAHAITLTAAGSTLTATLDGGSTLTYGSANTNPSSTRWGLRLDGCTVDNFKVTKP